MKTEFMVALTQLSAEKHLPKEVVLAAIESALASAYKKEASATEQDISAKINPNTGEVKVYIKKTVVETPTDLLCEISLTEAQKLDKNAQIDDVTTVELHPQTPGALLLRQQGRLFYNACMKQSIMRFTKSSPAERGTLSVEQCSALPLSKFILI